MVYIGAVATRHAQAGAVSKVFGFAHGAQGSAVAGRAIGGTVAGTGPAGVGSRACHEGCGRGTVWNVPVVVLVLECGKRGQWIDCRAIGTVGTSNAFPRGVVVVGVV